jgi:hypothetical protein
VTEARYDRLAHAGTPSATRKSVLMTLSRKLLSLVLLAMPAAAGTATVDRSIAPQGPTVASAPLRQNFAVTSADINGLYPRVARTTQPASETGSLRGRVVAEIPLEQPVVGAVPRMMQGTRPGLGRSTRLSAARPAGRRDGQFGRVRRN